MKRSPQCEEVCDRTQGGGDFLRGTFDQGVKRRTMAPKLKKELEVKYRGGQRIFQTMSIALGTERTLQQERISPPKQLKGV